MKKYLAVLSFAVFLLMGAVSNAAPKICIDPGHGGTDSGATSSGVLEKNLNLDAALQMRTWMNMDTQDTAGGYAWNVIMTRSTDATVSLSARVNYANSNSANEYLSIHSNAGGGYGSETFCYYTGSSKSFALRDVTNEELISHGKLYNRGCKTAGFYVIKYTSMPAALTEMGFVDNAGDRAKLTDAAWRKEVAKGFLHAFQRYYGYAAYTPSAAVTLIVDDANSGFTASSNWGLATWASDKYGSGYHYRDTGATSDPATWNVSVSQAGYYKVYAWWSAWSNRAISAPYIISHSSGSSTVYANQQSNGGKWNLMGTFYLNAGTNNVKLSCWTTSGSIVVADAIKWVK